MFVAKVNKALSKLDDNVLFPLKRGKEQAFCEEVSEWKEEL